MNKDSIESKWQQMKPLELYRQFKREQEKVHVLMETVELLKLNEENHLGKCTGNGWVWNVCRRALARVRKIGGDDG